MEIDSEDRRCSQSGCGEVVSVLRTQNQAWQCKFWKCFPCCTGIDFEQKVIFHLEAFVAKFMRIVERYVLVLFLGVTNTHQLNSYLMGMDF